MWASRSRILGAALAAALGTHKLVRSEAEVSPEPTSTNGETTDLVARAKKILQESREAPAAMPRAPTQRSLTQDEASRARAVLDRYYALSKEAQAANVLKTEETKEETPKKAVVTRVMADDVFETFEVPQGAFCKKYVICGGGTAAWAAIEAILEEDANAAKDILLISDEVYHPYNRTVLSKELWEEENKDVFRTEEGAKKAVEYGYKWAKGVKVASMRGKRVVQLDVDEKIIEISDGTKLQYDKLLLATGGTPKVASSVAPALAMKEVEDRVGVFRTLDDYRELKSELEKDDKGVVIIGGGFLGTELAVALASSSTKVSLVVAEAGVLYRVLPRYVCEYLARRLSDVGVNVVRSAVVTGASKKEDLVSLSIASPDAEHVQGGKVLVAVGIDPTVDLARDAGLELDSVNGGIMVSDFMMAEPDVFAAGDVASFHDRSLGRRRVEHWDHAVVSGRIAGKNMAGGRARYGLQSMFWSDLSNIGVSFTAVGRVESHLETIAVWNLEAPAVNGAPSANEYKSGVVYYLQNGGVVGAVLWNPKRGAGGLRRARALIDAKTRISEMDQATLAGLVRLEDTQFRTAIRTKAQ